MSWPNEEEMGGYSDLFYYKSPSLVGLVVKALEGREERQGLDLRRCQMPSFDRLVTEYCLQVIEINTR